MKNTDCQYYCKGGWCGKVHDEYSTISAKGVEKKIVSLRCSEVLRRQNGSCKYGTPKIEQK